MTASTVGYATLLAAFAYPGISVSTGRTLGATEWFGVMPDPTVLATGSYTIAYPMFLDNKYEMFEYACHEGNYGLRNILSAARADDAAEAAQSKK